MIKSKNITSLRLTILAASVMCCVVPGVAQDTVWNGNMDTDFFADGNWSASAPDSPTEYGVIDSTDPNHMAVIDASTGSVTLDGVNLGELSGGGNVIQNGGTLIFNASTTTKIGGNGSLPSTWVLNNDAVLLYDGPLDGGGSGYGLDGGGSDFDVGNGTSEATFELHDTAILRIADDLKISDNGVPAGGHVSLDGDSRVTVGSGTSVGPDGPATLAIAGNALYVSGNSAGPGNTAQGYTNEGYLAMHDADVTVSDSGRLWIRTLQHRNGSGSITVEDQARFDVFEVFFNASPVLGTTTVMGDVNGSERTSEVSESSGDVMNITVKDSGVMTVDSAPSGASWNGLALSGGTNRGGNGSGGETTLEVRDQGTLSIQQDLNMTLGFGADAKSTLKVRGPDTSIAVNGDLRMALDEFDFENPGTAAIHAVITASTHTTIDVGGDINIDNGDLIVELDGYTPNGGESYELISAGSITGTSFESEDFSLASLLPELSWEVSVNGSSVFINVLGSAGIPGDFDGDGDVDIVDFGTFGQNFGLTGQPTDPPVDGDFDGDGDVDIVDFGTFGQNFGTGTGSGSAVPEPTSMGLALIILASFIGSRRR